MKGMISMKEEKRTSVLKIIIISATVAVAIVGNFCCHDEATRQKPLSSLVASGKELIALEFAEPLLYVESLIYWFYLSSNLTIHTGLMLHQELQCFYRTNQKQQKLLQKAY